MRFSREGVFENQRSPAAYLNDERFGNVEVPDSADPKAAPEWKAVAAGVSYSWHDHRVHWMSPAYPRKVEEAKDVEHHIFDWKVPGTVDGERLAIAGSLDYVPPDDDGGSTSVLLAWIAAALVVALAGGALAWYLARRRRAAPSS